MAPLVTPQAHDILAERTIEIVQRLGAVSDAVLGFCPWARASPPSRRSEFVIAFPEVCGWRLRFLPTLVLRPRRRPPAENEPASCTSGGKPMAMTAEIPG